MILIAVCWSICEAPFLLPLAPRCRRSPTPRKNTSSGFPDNHYRFQIGHIEIKEHEVSNLWNCNDAPIERNLQIACSPRDVTDSRFFPVRPVVVLTMWQTSPSCVINYFDSPETDDSIFRINLRSSPFEEGVPARERKSYCPRTTDHHEIHLFNIFPSLLWYVKFQHMRAGRYYNHMSWSQISEMVAY